jgi:hypothetical protein
MHDTKLGFCSKVPNFAGGHPRAFIFCHERNGVEFATQPVGTCVLYCIQRAEPYTALHLSGHKIDQC